MSKKHKPNVNQNKNVRATSLVILGLVVLAIWCLTLTGCEKPTPTPQQPSQQPPKYINPGAMKWTDLQEQIDQAEDSVTIDLTGYLYPISQYENHTFVVPSNMTVILNGNKDMQFDNIAFVFEGDNVVYINDVNIASGIRNDKDLPLSVLHFMSGQNRLVIRGTNSINYTLQETFTISGLANNALEGFIGVGAAIGVPEGASLTIKGEGSVLTVGNGCAASIGGGYKTKSGTIIIESAVVTSQTWSLKYGTGGAAIGGGSGADGGTTIINGGTVRAQGIDGTAAIGGGCGGSGGIISISGGVVEAFTEGGGAAIGGGLGAGGGEISISGGEITAFSTFSNTPGQSPGQGAAIGNGYNGKGGSLTITGGSLLAFGSGATTHQAIDCTIVALPDRYLWQAGNIDDDIYNIENTYPGQEFTNALSYSFVKLQAY